MAKVFLAGHTGLVGSAIQRALTARGYTNLVTRTHAELDLTVQADVERFFAEERPDQVILAAARVGGIQANNQYRADFIYQNLAIQSNVIHAAWKFGVQKLLFLGSTCIYPREAPQPIREEYLLTGPLEPTNEPYAIAKIAGLKMCESYNRQYGTNFIAVMPTNLYGPNDNFDLETSHVLPAILRKMVLARHLDEGNMAAIREDLNKRPVAGITGQHPESDILAILREQGITTNDIITQSHGNTESPDHSKISVNPRSAGSASSAFPFTESPDHSKISVNPRSAGSASSAFPFTGSPDHRTTTLSLWGSGTPLREFLWVDDMADACLFVMENVDYEDIQRQNVAAGLAERGALHLNLGSGEEISIHDLALLIQQIVGFRGEINFDATKPDGTPRKLTDVSKLHTLGWTHQVHMEEGIRRLWRWYQESVIR